MVDTQEKQVERLHNLEDQAVFALTQLVGLCLNRDDFKSQRMFRQKGQFSESCWSLAGISEAESQSGVSGHALMLLENPGPTALRDAIHIIGAALYENTKSTVILSRVLERVADAFPDKEGDAEGIMDHAFHGIGNWLS